jgi:hypothetical protein
MLQNVKMTEHMAEKSKMTETIAKKTQILPNQLLNTFYFQVERVEANKSVVRTFCTRNAWSLSTKLRNTSFIRRRITLKKPCSPLNHPYQSIQAHQPINLHAVRIFTEFDSQNRSNDGALTTSLASVDVSSITSSAKDKNFSSSQSENLAFTLLRAI